MANPSASGENGEWWQLLMIGGLLMVKLRIFVWNCLSFALRWLVLLDLCAPGVEGSPNCMWRNEVSSRVKPWKIDPQWWDQPLVFPIPWGLTPGAVGCLAEILAEGPGTAGMPRVGSGWVRLRGKWMFLKPKSSINSDFNKQTIALRFPP